MSGAAGFGLDTVALSGPLPARLAAIARAGFTRVWLRAEDLVEHPGGVADAVRIVRASGLAVGGFQVLRDYEGLEGALHDYKVGIAQQMLRMARAVGAPVLLVASSSIEQASADLDVIARDLRKLAMLAVPLGIRIAYEALSWGRTVDEFTTAWDVVLRADAPNLGLALDSFHAVASDTALDELQWLDPLKIFLVQLSDFLWELPSVDARRETARHFRVFPGEGLHSARIAAFVRALDALGWRGDTSFEVYNDDYRQLPPDVVAARGARAAAWIGDEVLKRSAPLANQMRLRRAAG